jgi:hypothetical protein
MWAFVGWLSREHASLPIAHKADIVILSVFACTFAPRAGFRSILHHWHDHIDYLQKKDWLFEMIILEVRRCNLLHNGNNIFSMPLAF